MLMMIPRAAVCADRIIEVLDTESSVVRADRAGAPTVERARHAGASTTSSSAYPGADVPVLRDVSFDGATRPDRRRSSARTGAGKTHAGQPGPAAVRRHRRARCSSTASTYATSSRTCSGAGSGWCRRRRTCSPAPCASNLRYGKPDATDEELWAALEIAQARDFVEAHARRARRARSPRAAPTSRGGQRQRLAIARALVTPAGDLPVRRLLLGARPRHRRAAARGAATGDRATRPCSSSPSGSPRSATPTRSSCSRTARSSVAARHDELLETCATYAEIVAVPAERGGGGMSDRTQRRRAAAGASSRRPSASRPAPVGPAAARSAAAWSARRRCTFGPSAKRLRRPAAPERGQGRAPWSLLAVAQREPHRRSGRRSSATPPT